MVSVYTLLTAAVAALPLVTGQLLNRTSPALPTEFRRPLFISPTKRPTASYTDRRTRTTIDYYEVKIKKVRKNIFPGLGKANLVGYDGYVPGPTFRVEKGRETVVRFINEQDRNSVVHLHGSYSRAPFDGWAEDVIPPPDSEGKWYKDYYYPNQQAARTLWYHDHAVGITAVNANSGMAGFYILQDSKVERRLGLPQGKYDIPLMFNSKYYTAEGDLQDISTETESAFGDTFDVNGVVLPYLDVEPRKYRFRMLNAAASRTFNFTITDHKNRLVTMNVVGSDAGFLSHVVKTESLVTAMAERWDIVVDFSPYKGKKLVMHSNNTFVDDEYEGLGKVMQFRVGRRVRSYKNNGRLPNRLVSLDIPVAAANLTAQEFAFSRIFPNGDWTINGLTFADPNNRLIHNVPKGTVEKWRLEGGGGWSHPVHVHLVDFQIVSRISDPTPFPGTNPGRTGVLPYEAAALKDVVAVGENEIIEVVAKFAPWNGMYMFHCHNLIHEDHDMMAAFNVTGDTLRSKGYKKKLSLADPMAEQFRAQRYSWRTQRTSKTSTLKKFIQLKAYSKEEKQ